MTTIRSFIAIELSDESRQTLADLQDRLKALVPSGSVRWTAAKNIHLTLHFLGDIEAGQVATVTEILESKIPAFQPFTLELAGLGCFPNMRRPRIVWVGVAGETETLGQIHQALGQSLDVIGFVPDSRPFSPHLTIGRVKKGLRSRELNRLGQILQQEQPTVGQLSKLPVSQISLMKSDLKPSGPLYTQLARGQLNVKPSA